MSQLKVAAVVSFHLILGGLGHMGVTSPLSEGAQRHASCDHSSLLPVCSCAPWSGVLVRVLKI